MKRHVTLSIVVLFILPLFLLSGCRKKPIEIGFIGDLSSENAQLAIDARNAVEYYVDNLNEDGGINGRQIQLVIKDDESDPETATRRHREFVEEGVKVVIGHMTSSMSNAVLDSADEELLFLSPSMSTSALSARDDYFLRTSPTNDMQSITFVDYALENNVDNLLIVYDEMNANYTEPLAIGIEELYLKNGLNIVESVGFDSRTESTEAVADRLVGVEFDNILILAQATNSAYIIQNLSKTHDDFGTYSVSWSMTNDFITNGGQVVEGTVFIGTYKPEIASEANQNFTRGFFDRFSYEPTFISFLAYDAIDVLCKSIEDLKEIEVESVKDAIIAYGEFDGLNESFEIDEYGDSTRAYMLYRLTDGRFIPIR